MLISLKWLRELVDFPEDLQEFCDRLDLTGTGVEGVTRIGADLDGVLIGEVVSCDPHPDSDHMHVCCVDVGSSEPLQIVCGAPNARVGIKVAVATVGTTLPGDVKIKKSKLRGVASLGMMCSERELGLGSSHEGIIELPPDAPVGLPYMKWLGAGDTIIDVEITPNRPDCLSMRGIAREVGAMYDADVAFEDYSLEEGEGNVCDEVSVTVEDAELCPRYTARVIKGVKIGPSPDWLAERVRACGARPINNVVDITNYVLYAFGQPLHAFDMSTLAKGEDGKVDITVRAAFPQEKFTTLDGEERILTEDMTVISSGGRPVALAGVMGGLDSEVREQTCDILLESAAFSPAHTSRTSRNLSLMSESSLRYERGVDDNTCEEFSRQAAALMAAVCAGQVVGGVVDVWGKKTEPVKLTFRQKRFCEFVGADIPLDFARRTLSRLGCEVEEGDGSDFSVVAPTFRPDLAREIDLYEEVLRIYGVDRVEMTLPAGRGATRGRTGEQVLHDRIGEVLRACGLNETMTYSIVQADDLDRLRMTEEGRGQSVELINPMSQEQNVMRRSIVPGLLRGVSYNINHGVADVQLFEQGTVFAAAEGRKNPRERKMVAGVMCGAWQPAVYNGDAHTLDFFDGKGVLENLMRELCCEKVSFRVLDGKAASHLQPGRAAEILSGGAVLGWIGEIHPLALKDFDIDSPVTAFELDEKTLIAAARPQRDYKEIPQFPAVEMDLALVVDEGMAAADVEQAIRKSGGKLLAAARLFDVYRDEDKLGKGKKSLAFSLEYRDLGKTLSSEEVDKAHARLVKKVCASIGAETR